MKRLVLIVSCLVFGVIYKMTAQTTQATLQKTGELVITVYAKPTSTINSGSNVNVLFAVSLPVDGPESGVIGASLIGGNITPATTETIGGRKCYPFAIETLSSTSALTQNVDNPIATITFPSSESGDVVQLNDFTATGTTNVYWYISLAGGDITNYDEKFYGTNATNGPDSYVDANAPLPVSLVSFQAEKYQERSTSLTWATASEFNTSHFLVQRSTDKKTWSTIGKVNAAGNSQIVQNYQFVDQNVYNGADSRLSVYYRLQMVDFDGQLGNSPIENVIFGTDAKIPTDLSVAVFPNPATDGVNVEWNGGNAIQPTSIEMYDVAGKLILTHRVAENSSREYVDFGHSKIQSGLYLLRLMNGAEPLDHQQIVIGQNR